MQVNNLGGALELRLNFAERFLLSNALQNYSAATEERRVLAVIPAICTTLNAIEPDDGDVGSLYVRSVDRVLLSDALRHYSDESPRGSFFLLQGMITALDVVEVAG